MGIKEGTYEQIAPCMLEGIIVGISMSFKGKTIGCRRYRAKEDFSKVVGGRHSYQKISKQGEGGTIVIKRSTNPLGNVLGALKVL